jgi:hypothetical protein
VPAAIVEAFDDGRLTTNPERLVGFFDGVSQIVDSVKALPSEQKDALGGGVVEQIKSLSRQWSDKQVLVRLIDLANLVPLLSLDRSPFDPGQSNFSRQERRYIDNSASYQGTLPGRKPQVGDFASQAAFQTMIGLFENGQIDVNNQETLLQFFDSLSVVGRALQTIPPTEFLHSGRQLSYAIEDRMVDEIGQSIEEGNLERARNFSNLAIFLDLTTITSSTTRNIFYGVRNLENN